MPAENKNATIDFFDRIFIRRSGGRNPHVEERAVKVRNIIVEHASPLFRFLGKKFHLPEPEQRRIVGALANGFMQRSRLHQFSFQLLGKRRGNIVGRVELRFEAPARKGEETVKILPRVIGPEREDKILRSTGDELQKALSKKVGAIAPVVGRQFALADVEVRHE